MSQESQDPLVVLEAICSAIVPGLDVDVTPGAREIGAARYVAHYLGDRFTSVTAAVLAEDPMFLSLAPAERAETVRRLADRVDGMRALIALTVGAVFGSWSGTDDTGAMVRTPLGWELSSYDGPRLSRGPLGH